MYNLYETIRSILWPRVPFRHCLVGWCGILIAGLWPFHGPRNEVTWAHDEPALVLSGYNVIFSPGMFSSSGSGCSIELWLTPGMTFDSSTILGFYTAASPLQFSLRQYNDALIVASEVSDKKLETHYKGWLGQHLRYCPESSWSLCTC